MAAPQPLLTNNVAPAQRSFQDKLCCCIPPRHRMKVAVATWVVVGVAALMNPAWDQELDFATAIYVVAQIVTTVGYGDVTPTTQSMKLFLALYALVGIGLVAGFIGDLLDSFVAATDERARSRMRKIEAALQTGDTAEKVWLDEKTKRLNHVLAASGIWVVTVVFWTLWFTYVGDCEEDTHGKPCPDGQKRTLIDAFYMCCITLTTIGFGDQTPTTTLGRLVGTVWMLLGMAATAHFLTSVTHYFQSTKSRRVTFDKQFYDQCLSKATENRHLYDELHVKEHNDGKIHKWQFIMYMLVKHDLCAAEDLDFVMSEFKRLDTDNSGVLDVHNLPGHGAK